MNEKVGKEEGEQEERPRQTASQFANVWATMAVKDPTGVTSHQEQQHQGGQGPHHPRSTIPFETIDDEEMMAIETALLQAHSVSFAYHSSTARASRLFPTSSIADSAEQLSTSDSVVGNKLSSLPIPTKKFSTSFVYNVAAESSWPIPEPGVDLRSGQEEADTQESAIFAGFSAILGDELPSSQLSGNYESQSSSQLGGTDEALSGANAPTVAPVPESDESIYTACSESFADQDSQVSNGTTAYVVSSAKRVVVGRSATAQSNRSSSKERTSAGLQDIEDLAGSSTVDSSQGEGTADSRHGHAAVHVKAPVTLFQRKSGRGLSVTDFTASEWCEKQVEFTLNRGKPEQTPAMKAGSERHLELEKEVITRVEIEIFTKEDTWAVRLLNFISGARQLLSEGLTRELPV